MGFYVVNVTENLSRSFIVEANNAEEAENKLHDAYTKECFLLDGWDWIGCDVTTEHEADEGDIEHYDDLNDYY